MSTTTTRAVEAAMRLADECKSQRNDDPVVCAEIQRDYELVQGELTRLRAALDALDNMDPEDYKTGQSHLSPAFRQINYTDALRFIARTVNGVLHGTDENGRPLPEQEKADV